MKKIYLYNAEEPSFRLWWGKAQKEGMKQQEFDKLWWEAVNELRERVTRDNSDPLKMCEALLKSGDEGAKKTALNFLNKQLAKMLKKYKSETGE
jgi:hypothetical protein